MGVPTDPRNPIAQKMLGQLHRGQEVCSWVRSISLHSQYRLIIRHMPLPTLYFWRMYFRLKLLDRDTSLKSIARWGRGPFTP